MLNALLADLVILMHLIFVLFVLLGGLASLKWPKLMWLHLSAVAWGATVEFTGWTCPLTPLENWLREQAGQTGYQGDFIGRYLLPILYPAELTPHDQTLLGMVVIVVNLAVYGWLWRKRKDVFLPDRKP